MAHLSGVSEESVSQDVRDVYERVKKKYGTLLEPVSIAAHNPGMAQCPLQSPHGYSRTKSHRGTRRPAAVAATKVTIVHTDSRTCFSHSQGTPRISVATRVWLHLKCLPQAFYAVSCVAAGRTQCAAIGAARSLPSGPNASKPYSVGAEP